MTHENQRISLSKRLFREALLRLLKDKELSRISVTELCREADLNRSTFYRHYEIPQDVLSDLYQDWHQDFRKAVPLPQKTEELRPFVRRLCRFMEDNAPFIRTALLRDSSMDLALFFSDVMQEAWDEMDPSFAEGVSPDTKRLFSLYNAGGVYLMLHQWFLGNIRKSADEMADCIFELMNKVDPEGLRGPFGFGQTK